MGKGSAGAARGGASADAAPDASVALTAGAVGATPGAADSDEDATGEGADGEATTAVCVGEIDDAGAASCGDAFSLGSGGDAN
jgi:hypothetical protein